MAAATLSPRRPLTLRYSLRMLLLALTAFAIGFPIWYRWPYQEDDAEMAKIRGAKRIVTWQRQWGGGRLMHGPEEIYFGTKTESRRTYRNGVLHGPFELAMGGGGQESGQYIDGKREGLWIARDSLEKLSEAQFGAMTSSTASMRRGNGESIARFNSPKGN